MFVSIFELQRMPRILWNDEKRTPYQYVHEEGDTFRTLRVLYYVSRNVLSMKGRRDRPSINTLISPIGGDNTVKE